MKLDRIQIRTDTDTDTDTTEHCAATCWSHDPNGPHIFSLTWLQQPQNSKQQIAGTGKVKTRPRAFSLQSDSSTHYGCCIMIHGEAGMD